MRRRFILAALTVAALLAACSQPPAGPSLTADQAGDKVASLADSFGALLSDPDITAFVDMVAGLTPAGMSYQEASQLRRGVYEYDDVAGEWVKVGDSDDLVLLWTVEPGSSPAQLVADWDASAPTVMRTLVGGDEVELPTGARFQLSVDGQVVADIAQTGTWPVNQCGTLSEVGDLYFDGLVTDGDGALTFDMVGLSLEAGDTTATASTSGGLALTVEAGEAWVDWDLSLDLAIDRDADCVVSDVEVTSGHVQVAAGVETPAGSASIGVTTGFAPVFASGTGEITGLELTGGSLVLDGALAVTWDGVLDDGNGNGIPGDGLVLTFSDGSMTLEEFIQDQFGFFALGSRLLGALR
jgi:hypothetical protein